MFHRSVMMGSRGVLKVSRRFCRTGGPVLEVTPQIRQKNAFTAVALCSCVAGIYYVAISKMREETDDLSAIISETK